jgi:hypothetical protein
MLLSKFILMTVSVPRRVHIAPQGFEDDRIYLPAIDLEADIVILVRHKSENETGEECYGRIKDNLEDNDIEVDYVSCDIFDLNDSLETILATIRGGNPDDNINVNISAGSKITAIAGMLACMFSDADPYYVVPEGYNETSEGESRDTVSHGMEDTVGLPAYPVTEPDTQLIQVLSFINEEQPEEGPHGVLLKEIGEYLLEHDLPAVEGSGKSPGEAEQIYHIVNEKIVDPLRKRSLIAQTTLDGGKQIRTTPEGEEMLSLGESLLAKRSGN